MSKRPLVLQDSEPPREKPATFQIGLADTFRNVSVPPL
jgi:hypothetical protein